MLQANSKSLALATAIYGIYFQFNVVTGAKDLPPSCWPARCPFRV